MTREVGVSVARIVGERRRRARFPGGGGEGAPTPVARDLDQRPDDRDAAEPSEARERVDVDGPRRQDPERDRVPPSAHGGQEQREGEQEQRHDRLLERLLREVRGRQVRKRHERRRPDARRAAQATERGVCDQRGERRDRQGEPGEDVDRARAEQAGDTGDERVGAERIALIDEHRLRPEPLVDPVGQQQVGGHVVVDEPDPEDPDVAGGDERDCGEQGGEDGGGGRAADGAAKGVVPAGGGLTSLSAGVLASMLRSLRRAPPPPPPRASASVDG